MDPDKPINPIFKLPPSLQAPSQIKSEPLDDAKAGQQPQKPRQRARPKSTPPIFLFLLGLVPGLFLAFLTITYPQLFNQPFGLEKSSSSVEISSRQVETTLSSTPVPTAYQEEPVKMSTEQTFIAIKPDGVQRGLVGPIISRFESRGYKLVAIKLITPSKQHLEKHYEDLKDKPFFPGLITYMLSGPICAMVWEGRDAVKTGRTILGATNPLASAPGTIRGDYAIDVGRNVCHGSDSVENGKKEIALWFGKDDLVSYKASQFDWIYEKA